MSINTKLLTTRTFSNADNVIVPYVDQEISWRVSVYGICIKDDHILLAKNKAELLYDVPGGGVDIGESFEEALLREGLEEAGVELQMGKVRGVVNDWFCHANGHFYQAVQIFYDAQVLREVGQRTDPAMVWSGWVPLSELGDKYPVPVALQKVLND